jgi:hypothetical protein
MCHPSGGDCTGIISLLLNVMHVVMVDSIPAIDRFLQVGPTTDLDCSATSVSRHFVVGDDRMKAVGSRNASPAAVGNKVVGNDRFADDIEPLFRVGVALNGYSPLIRLEYVIF